MRKYGRTAAGAQRWRCTDCAATYSFRREDQTQQATFTAFLDYVLGKNAQYEIDATATGRSARRRFAWCWHVPTPPLAVTGEIYDQLFIDGIYLAYNWALLTAVNECGEVIARQWATTENAAAYTALLDGMPPPRLITCDGAAGALKAIQAVWGEDAPPVQRCLLHVHRRQHSRPHESAKNRRWESITSVIETAAESHQHHRRRRVVSPAGAVPLRVHRLVKRAHLRPRGPRGSRPPRQDQTRPMVVHPRPRPAGIQTPRAPGEAGRAVQFPHRPLQPGAALHDEHRRVTQCPYRRSVLPPPRSE